MKQALTHSVHPHSCSTTWHF